MREACYLSQPIAFFDLVRKTFLSLFCIQKRLLTLTQENIYSMKEIETSLLAKKERRLEQFSKDIYQIILQPCLSQPLFGLWL